MACIYKINKGVNKPVEFRGLKAQYIWYLGGGIFVLLILYGALYILGVNQYVGLMIIAILGMGLVMQVYKLSNKYGEYGMMKALSRKALPQVVRCKSRKVFIKKAGKG
ncbi:DUF4133 domain-containing protein [Chitinophaga japonensis]|uniref:Uncharacterized protein DUF4133 n=1 Tax=Chitinophaga japonensis TaxID=104662 RepID=A0A562T2F4_CHIJA|nr:DUF4133 domain-containing protein [Chitinophaga japonensis]TWI87837.1 uncharacterized protein DUF4133 [Chitinophaga japonensis]